MSQVKLLNFTKKTSKDLHFIRRPELLFFPFDRMISRLSYKADLFNYSLQSEPIAQFTKISSPVLSWEECCLQRAEQLLRLNKEKYYLAFSGGIDSTTMLVSILRTWPKADLKRIVIYLSHHSVEENPGFFDRYLAEFPLVNSLIDVSQELFANGSLMVTGELGDQLFGADILGTACQLFGDQALAADYREMAPQVLDTLTKCPGAGAKIFAHLHPMVEECPFPIRTMHDFFWWFNFSQKWQHVKFRFCHLPTWDTRARYGDCIMAFFDTPDFQRWSLANHDLKIKRTWDSYKFTAKEFIYDFTKDPAQLHLKKIQSLEKTYVLSEMRIAVTEDYGTVERPEDLEKYERFVN